MTTTLHQGDCLEVMARLAREGVKVDSIVTDPPYHLTSIVKRFGKTSLDRDGTNERRAAARSDGMARLSRGFMGKQWDGGDIAFNPETWALAFDLLKPCGHMFAFSGTRTYHRMACAIEDAGFVIRDQFAWCYGSGFPKSHDISKAIDKASGAKRESLATGKPVKRMIPGADQARDGWIKDNGREYVPSITAPATDAAAQWDGWGTAVKPAWEPICLAQKPVEGTIAGNVLKHGVGGLNIDGCRIEATGESLSGGRVSTTTDGWDRPWKHDEEAIQACRARGDLAVAKAERLGRYPANLCHDGSPEVLARFPESDGQQFATGPKYGSPKTVNTYGDYGARDQFEPRGDTGSAARFFYAAKADGLDRWGSKHPTVKPIDLIRYYARMITPPGGLILDPFAGSGTLGIAAIAEGFDSILIEREAEYAADIRERIAFYEGEGRHSLASKNRNAAPPKAGENPLIDWIESRTGDAA